MRDNFLIIIGPPPKKIQILLSLKYWRHTPGDISWLCHPKLQPRIRTKWSESKWIVFQGYGDLRFILSLSLSLSLSLFVVFLGWLERITSRIAIYCSKCCQINRCDNIYRSCVSVSPFPVRFCALPVQLLATTVYFGLQWSRYVSQFYGL